MKVYFGPYEAKGWKGVEEWLQSDYLFARAMVDGVEYMLQNNGRGKLTSVYVCDSEGNWQTRVYVAEWIALVG